MVEGSGRERSSRRSAPTIRALAIIELLLDDPERVWSLTELALRSGVAKPTAFGIVQTLVSEDYLIRVGRELRLGPALVALIRCGDGTRSLAALARPHLDALAHEEDTSCFLGGVAEDRVVVLATGDDHRADTLPVGAAFPITHPPSIPFLAWCSEGIVAVALTAGRERFGIGWAAAARQQVDDCRRRGYSVGSIDAGLPKAFRELARIDATTSRAMLDAVEGALRDLHDVPRMDGPDHHDGPWLATAPVFSSRGDVAAIFATATSDLRSLHSQLPGLGERVRAAARSITGELGGVDPWRTG